MASGSVSVKYLNRHLCQQAKTFRTNGIARGVFVTPGRHMVNFRYLPISFISGAFISVLVLMILIIILVLPKHKIVARKKI